MAVTALKRLYKHGDPTNGHAIEYLKSKSKSPNFSVGNLYSE
jgi:hypothetical protein